MLGVAATFVIAYLLIYFGSSWRISNTGLHNMLHDFNVIAYVEKADLGFDIGANPAKITHKDQLDGFDALSNAFSLYVSCATVIPFVILAMFAVWVGTLFAGDFVGFIVVPILGALVLALAPFLPVVTWIAMLFQEATGYYYILWLLLGVPVMGLGYASSAAPGYIVVILIPVK